MRVQVWVCALWAAGAFHAAAQERLPLARAVELVVARNASLQAGRASVDEAAARIPQAKSALLPRVEILESAERGTQPVFAFGSLLSQRRFTEADFDIGRLNHPRDLGHHRTALIVEQLLFDGGAARASVRAAATAERAAGAGVTRSEQDLALATVVAYASVGKAAAERNAARAAVAAAADDRRRASDRRDLGLATDADALAASVQHAAMLERQIGADAAHRLAVAELNALMGAPLDQDVVVEDLGVLSPPLAADVGRLDIEAAAARIEPKQAELAEDLARLRASTARSALLPRVVARGAYELAGPNPIDRASSWLVGGYLRWTISAGGAELASLREARATVARAGFERDAVEQDVRLGVRRATVVLDAAVAREAVARASVDQAAESQRIVRDRYEAGLTSVTDLLRAAEAVETTSARHLASRYDVVVGRATMARALGRSPLQIAASVTATSVAGVMTVPEVAR
jgi:outer membrane protein